MDELRFSVFMVTLTAVVVTTAAFKAITNNAQQESPYIQRNQRQLAPDIPPLSGGCRFRS